jgi:hypothetical protein
MALFVQDTFTGTDGTTLASHTGETGASWTKHPQFTGSLALDTNRVRNATSDTNAGLYYASGTPLGADYEVQADLLCKDAASVLASAFVCGRLDSAVSAGTYYFGGWNRSSNIFQVLKLVAGVSTSLGSSSDGGAAAGTTKTAKLSMVSTTIQLLIDGASVVSVTDSAISAAGKAGLRMVAVAGGGNTNGFHVDNLTATDVFANPPIADHYFRRLQAVSRASNW